MTPKEQIKRQRITLFVLAKTTKRNTGKTSKKNTENVGKLNKKKIVGKKDAKQN